MPATETTWRDLKLMHVVFGVSSVVMLATTIWMMADDHNRPWKVYQRQFQDIESWTAQARIDEQQSEEFRRRRAELESELAAARDKPLDLSLVEQFLAEAKSANTDESELTEVETEFEEYRSAESGGSREEQLAARDQLLSAMRDVIARFRFRETNLTTEVKGVRAELDKARAYYDMAVGKGRPEEEIAQNKDEFDRIQARLEGPPELRNGAETPTQDETPAVGLMGQQQAAKLQREKLEQLYNAAAADEIAVRKELADHDQKLQLLHTALSDRAPNIGKGVLSMPVLDAFGSPLKIDQIWLPQLTLNNNFRDVARFDRCATCHQGMDKTQPGSATAPGYLEEHRLTLELQSPTMEQAQAVLAEASDRGADGEEHSELTEHERNNELLARLYGFRIAERGLLNESDATVSVVLPETRAASAGLMSGDVIEYVGDAGINSQRVAFQYLIDRTEWTPLTLTVRRGVPQPFSSHPRLDLFVGSTSPHPMGKFGCSICHQGQGSSTSFDWASHTPNDLETAKKWSRDYGWFNNHHWILPMFPTRFAESGCLKCHHQVTELEPSDKYPDGPAPKLMRGYQLILKYGCYGCHEINGFDGPNKRIGPDLRNEPNVFAAAAQLRVDPGLKELGADAESLAEQVVASPENAAARRRLQELVAADVERAAAVAKERIKSPTKAAELPQPKLSPQSHKMEALLRDIEAAGDLRKVGPSLRYVGAKNSFEFLYDWIEDPHRFRPGTKMPRFFGLHDHLDGEGLAVAKEFEPVEVRAMSEYLLTASQPFEYLAPADGAEGSAERGKKVFEMRGCLACHSHAEFPKGKASHGPDLSRIGAKLAAGENGKKWLYSWVREPNRYHARTAMPNTFLEPQQDAEGNTTDPALDVTEYLLTSQQNWQPRSVTRQMSASDLASLEKLALQNLEDKFPASRARAFLKNGIPASQAGEVKGDEVALVGMKPEDRIAKIVEYVGRRSITKYGCFGCHDIPGYEDAKPIGTGLADWGRKESSRLAFENIMQYLHNGHGAHGKSPHGDHNHTPSPGDASTPGSLATSATREGEENTAEYATEAPFGTPEPAPLPAEIVAEHEFFLEKIASHEREGFIWQKLHDPRSYDFRKTENKKYNERLRMPKFYFSQDQHENDEAIEAIMTFVLGLVSEPPAAQYVYKPSPHRQTLVAGRKLLEKFNCGGCHVLETDRWKIEYRPGWAAQDAEPQDRKDQFTEPVPEFDDYEFLRPHFTPQEHTAAGAADRRNRLHAVITGAPVRDHTTGTLKRWADDGTPLEPDDPTPGNYEFILYEPAIINGVLWPVGGPNMRLQASMLSNQRPEESDKAVFPAQGGLLARLLYPAVVADNPTYNTEAKAQEAWGWLPPPLIGEGSKVQTGWLHDFLLDPYPIRPAAVLRMPKFNMSPREAETLANYFAAVDGATYPYEFGTRTRDSHLDQMVNQNPNHLSDALKIVTDNNYCVKCHLVADFNPGGDPKALAPQLERVHQRLRPDFVHRWIANPKRLLPYTGMPVNIPHNMPVSQQLYPGTSQQQLGAVVDLLMNFDRFTKQQYSIKPLIKPPTTPPAGTSNNTSAAGQNTPQ